MTDLLLCFYADDVTGSTDALEALASNGVETALFLDPPSDELLAQFASCRAIGIAGHSRSRSPAWMDENLPQVFAALKQIAAPLCQYKVCSTFDSSPTIGNIGRALEIGQRIFGNPWVPIAIAAPHLQRYVLFGNLFAASGGEIYRIDRHPAMSHHPVTPMHEADLRVHLAEQTKATIGLLDISSLTSVSATLKLHEILAQKPAGVLFDGLTEESIREAGRLIWRTRPQTPSFCVGSAGLTHALILHWREAGMIPTTPDLPACSEVDRLLVLSGSCSPATGRQIEWAKEHGYAAINVLHNFNHDSLRLRALREFEAGRSVILFSALGAADSKAIVNPNELGSLLGCLLRELVHCAKIRRAVIAGGDTSSTAIKELRMHALTFAGILSPGAPLCRVHSADPSLDGIELILKGGQVGPPNFFEIARKGRI